MTRPDKFPEWARVPLVDPVVGGSNIVEPPDQQKDDGWLRKQKPPANYTNYLFNKIDEWLKYLDGLSNPNTAKAWAVYDGATDTLENAYNITSVTRNQEGDYTFNMGITSTSSEYVVQVSCVTPLVNAATPAEVATQGVIGIAADNFSIKLADFAGDLRNSDQIYVVVFGNDFSLLPEEE